MLEDRGYNVDHLKNFTEDEIKEMMLNHITGKFITLADVGPLDIVLEKTVDTKTDKSKADTTEKIYIKYRMDSKFKGTASLTTQILEIYEKHLSTKDTLIILNLGHITMKIGVKDKVDEEFVNDLFIKKKLFRSSIWSRKFQI